MELKIITRNKTFRYLKFGARKLTATISDSLQTTNIKIFLNIELKKLFLKIF